jgi:hypothetical protein
VVEHFTLRVPRHKKNTAFCTLLVTALMLPFNNCSGFHVTGMKDLSSTSGAPLQEKHGNTDVFMASGHMGRTVMSCDDGQTWINDMSANDLARCWVTGDPNYVECDHTQWSGHGIDAAGGSFFANFGWGYNGAVRSTKDGVHWNVLRSDGWGGGVAIANNILFLLWGYGKLSSDQGLTWTDMANSPAEQMDHPGLRRLGDKFLLFGREGSLAISADQGATWQLASGVEPGWATGNFAEGNGVIVSLGEKIVANMPTVGYSAVSSDGGKTWTAQEQWSGQTWAGLIFNGTEFVSWSGGKKWTSPDGTNWTQTPLEITGSIPPLQFSGPVSFNAKTGTYVAIPSSWGGYYDKQKALRSADGVHWTELDTAHFKGGHPLFTITLGEMESKYCP